MIKQQLLVLLTALLLAACISSTQTDRNGAARQDTLQVDIAEDRQYLVKIGDTAPDFEMNFPDGTKMLLSDLRGKVVMLQFTASWCGVCRKEMPYIEKHIWQKHKDNPNFVLCGIDREEPAEKIAVLREATDVTYPIGMDPDGTIFGRYAEKNAGITRNVVIDRKGKIAMLTRLFDEEEFNSMVSVINNLLNQ